MSKENFDQQHILHNEQKTSFLGLMIQSLVAILKYLFAPHKLTIADGRRLKDIHESTGFYFPLKSERINREEKSN